MQDLVELARGRRLVALTGAGCSTESGIPDYRGPTAKPRSPMQHREFIEKPEQRPCGMDCRFGDPSGNQIRLAQVRAEF